MLHVIRGHLQGKFCVTDYLFPVLLRRRSRCPVCRGARPPARLARAHGCACLIWHQTQQQSPAYGRMLSAQRTYRNLALMGRSSRLGKPRQEDCSEGVGWPVAPRSTRVAGGQTAEQYGRTNDVLFIPGDGFQRPQQSRHVVSTADAVALLGKQFNKRTRVCG